MMLSQLDTMKIHIKYFLFKKVNFKPVFSFIMRLCMNFLLKVINCFLCILLPAVAIAQYNTTNDWDQTTAGKVRQVIQNRPHLDGGDSNYPGLMICEYPAGSGIEHLDEAALFFGGIVDGETRVTAGESWCKDNEVWPGSSPWDSVWVVWRGDSIDIGGIDAEGNMDYYWPGYTPVSDQDFIARYDDYNIIPSGGYEAHRPLFLDIVQQTFNWSTPLLENVVLWSFYITPTKYNVEDMYITLRYRSNIAPVEVGSDGDDDDRHLFFPESDLLVSEDMPDGVDG